MKLSNKPTEYLLLKAYTNSEGDSCDFAIVHITEEWKKQQAKRVEAVKPFADEYNFLSLNYWDAAVDFYQTDEDYIVDTHDFFAEKDWAFVELEKDEQEKFSAPESRLDCYKIVVYRNGNLMYKANGKHTGEEFYTEDFSLTQIIQQP
jgi:hypothetical protein